MSSELDQRLKGSGTRFRLYPQSPVLADYVEPETVWVSPLAGTLRPGPADSHMRVLDAIDKPAYSQQLTPPWTGAVHPAATPDADGHFDHHPPGSREFAACHMFGGVRRVLDIWEDYLGEPINVLSLEERRDRQLELVPLIDLEKNAQTGPGFLEMGYVPGPGGERQSFALNMDVLAHEVGHRVVFDRVGFPSDLTLTAEYRGFAESASDLVALITALHFDTVIDNVLDSTSGNLYVSNELSRFGELADNDQIRIASNSLRMDDVIDVATPPFELSQPALHELGEPLTGALFDVLVELFHETAADNGAVPRELADHAWYEPSMTGKYADVDEIFDRAYEAKPEAFRSALITARDAFGQRLARTWSRLSPHYLTFRDVAATFLAVDAEISGGRFQQAIADCFDWRGIGPARPLTRTSGDPDRRSWYKSQRFMCDRSPTRYRKERQARCRRLARQH